MTEIEQKKEEVPVIPPVTEATIATAQPEIGVRTALPAFTANEDKTPSKEAQRATAHPSKGEKMFNRIVYQGINYWVNLGLSLMIADYFRNLGGRQKLDNGVTRMAKGLSKLGMAPDKARKYSNTVLETSALVSGGWVILPLMKVLEDNKRPLVHWLNDKMGVSQIAPDGHKETADEIYIEKEQPHQSWFNVIKRRALAMAAVSLVTGPIIEHTVGEKKATDFITEKANKVLGSGYVPGGNFIVKNERAQRYVGFAALDWFYTMVTATVMRVTNGAGKGKMPKEIGDDFDPAVLDARHDRLIVAPVGGDSDTLPSAALEGFKKNKIMPTEKHTDRAKVSDAGYSLAP